MSICLSVCIYVPPALALVTLCLRILRLSIRINFYQYRPQTLLGHLLVITIIVQDRVVRFIIRMYMSIKEPTRVSKEFTHFSSKKRRIRVNVILNLAAFLAAYR